MHYKNSNKPDVQPSHILHPIDSGKYYASGDDDDDDDEDEDDEDDDHNVEKDQGEENDDQVENEQYTAYRNSTRTLTDLKVVGKLPASRPSDFPQPKYSLHVDRNACATMR